MTDAEAAAPAETACEHPFAGAHWNHRTARQSRKLKRTTYGFSAFRLLSIDEKVPALRPAMLAVAKPAPRFVLRACGFATDDELASYLAAYGLSPHRADTGKHCRVRNLGDAANGIEGCRMYSVTVLGSSPPSAQSAIPFTSIGDAVATESSPDTPKMFIIDVTPLC
jgi:hypothetical protein